MVETGSEHEAKIDVPPLPVMQQNPYKFLGSKVIEVLEVSIQVQAPHWKEKAMHLQCKHIGFLAKITVVSIKTPMSIKNKDDNKNITAIMPLNQNQEKEVKYLFVDTTTNSNTTTIATTTKPV